MPQIKVTPWRDQTELLEVKNQLYPRPDSVSIEDERRWAVDVVNAWKIRGGLPHEVEATAALTAALLHDETQQNNIPYCTEFALSGALCFFVTRLVDPGRSGIYVKSMYKTAEKIGLPATFVDVRHDATHGPLPSLVVLRSRAKEALRWLWDRYWSTLE